MRIALSLMSLRPSRGSPPVTGQDSRAPRRNWVHNTAVDSRGNVFTTEVDTGERAQRFRLLTQLPR